MSDISASGDGLDMDIFSLSPLSSPESSEDELDEDFLLLSPLEPDGPVFSSPFVTPSKNDTLGPGEINSLSQTCAVDDNKHEADASASFNPALQCPSTLPQLATKHALDSEIVFSSSQTAASSLDGANSSDQVPQEPSHKARRRGRCHDGRRQRRQQERENEFSHHEARLSECKDSAPPIRVDLATEKCSTTSTAFTGMNDSSGARRVFGLHELVGEGAKRKFEYVGWDGMIRRSVTDAKGRNVAFLAGQPKAEEWPLLMQSAAEALEIRRPRLSIPKEEQNHRRGTFPAVRCGVSHGGGSTRPGNLTNNKENTAVVEELCGMECFKRLAGFATSVMAANVPKLYHYYVERLGELHAKHPGIRRLFPSSVFAAASFNFGPRTACRKHKDFANLPFGLCAVTALGNFDPRKGGHLVLWECGLVIEFPPGATILLPSAIVAHSNTPVQSHETRYSFAQYTAGGLFRWIEHGCMLSADFYASLSMEELEAVRQKDAERWEHGLSLFERVDQIERGT
ncbi:hypothetical protein CVT26_009393 [Gymnopilus dilepis]|uniref:Uncharacterized protein n=1 Tax=Gymnopilus dilepis TaxID=231916 RepID=A0A409YIG1_9AGAR|nr:hypothetical protein CVT26_009393 [Gymnopilus dilepis]